MPVKIELRKLFAPRTREQKLPAADEKRFQEAYRKIAQTRNALGSRLNFDPDDPRHFFDHRAAWKAGKLGSATEHGSSQFKRPGHPRMIIPQAPFRYGWNTQKNKPATVDDVIENSLARDAVMQTIRAAARRQK